MQLGAFSISLSVKDIAASQAFYAKLGFEATGGDPDQGWVILKNEGCILGLFQDMFEKNILTFNPGWNQDAEALETFTDVRKIQADLQARGLTLEQEADPQSRGPASLVVVDPDGNPILIDQHI
ncbi:MAG: hypothetical protein Kilf2KO_10480 [Rhodospirillales bacterium]